MCIFDPYLHFNKIEEVSRKVLESYWNRKNRFAIVKLCDNKFLVFLVSDNIKPEIPGYPATAIQYFDKYRKAKKAIKKHYKRIGYTPINAEYGYWTR